jgi:hypothetical protein
MGCKVQTSPLPARPGATLLANSPRDMRTRMLPSLGPGHATDECSPPCELTAQMPRGLYTVSTVRSNTTDEKSRETLQGARPSSNGLWGRYT